MKLIKVQTAKDYAEAFFSDVFFKMAVNRVLDNCPPVEGVTIQKWIPITERLPEDGTDILAYMSDEFESRIFPANYDHGIWFDCIFNVSQSIVTHWMPLPEPPKEVTR